MIDSWESYRASADPLRKAWLDSTSLKDAISILWPHVQVYARRGFAGHSPGPHDALEDVFVTKGLMPPAGERLKQPGTKPCPIGCPERVYLGGDQPNFYVWCSGCGMRGPQARDKVRALRLWNELPRR